MTKQKNNDGYSIEASLVHKNLLAEAEKTSGTYSIILNGTALVSILTFIGNSHKYSTSLILMGVILLLIGCFLGGKILCKWAEYRRMVLNNYEDRVNTDPGNPMRKALDTLSKWAINLFLGGTLFCFAGIIFPDININLIIPPKAVSAVPAPCPTLDTPADHTDYKIKIYYR